MSKRAKRTYDSPLNRTVEFRRAIFHLTQLWLRQNPSGFMDAKAYDSRLSLLTILAGWYPVGAEEDHNARVRWTEVDSEGRLSTIPTQASSGGVGGERLERAERGDSAQLELPERDSVDGPDVRVPGSENFDG